MGLLYSKRGAKNYISESFFLVFILITWQTRAAGPDLSDELLHTVIEQMRLYCKDTFFT